MKKPPKLATIIYYKDSSHLSPPEIIKHPNDSRNRGHIAVQSNPDLRSVSSIQLIEKFFKYNYRDTISLPKTLV